MTETCRVLDYAARVVTGEIITCKHVQNTCLRHIRDLERDDVYFDFDAAKRAFRFIEGILCLNGGQFEGLPFILHPSQAFIVGSIFGWMRPTGKRRFRRAYIEQGKGNGKSPLIAAIGLYGLIADGESRAEIYAAASKFDQAKVMFRDARAMVQQSPELAEALQVGGGDNSPNIAFLETNSFFRPISGDKGQSGPRPHMALCDEVHEMENRNVIDMLERGFKFREQPLLVMTTNSGFDRSSMCWEEHEHACKVAQGTVQDDTTFSYVCGLDEEDNPFEDDSCWVKANPLLGHTISHEYLSDVVKQAKAIPGKRNNILRLHFCVWTDVESVWMPFDKWQPCEIENLEPDYTRPCYAGLDLSAKTDLTAMARVWKAADGTFDAIVDFWVPAENIGNREERDRVPYRQWAKDQHIRTTPGATVDYEHVAEFIAHAHGKNRITKMAYDRWAIALLKKSLDQQGCRVELVEFGQGFKDMSKGLDAIEAAILNERLRIKYNPCMRWNVSNAVIAHDPAGGRKFAKNKSNGRIDGVVALTMALSLASSEKGVNINEFLENPIRLRY